MLFTKLHPIVGEEMENAKEDYRQSKHVGQYRISSAAVYLPDGGYIPTGLITDITSDKSSVHVTGCCAGCVPVDRLILTMGESKQQLLFDSKREVQTALSLIQKKEQSGRSAE